MKTVLTKAGELWSASLLLRVAVGALAGAIGSSTVIGFIAEFGAVNYALAHGVRLPTEGVPFLRYAATAFSLCMFIAAIFAFIIIGLMLKGALVELSKWPRFRAEGGGTSISDLPLHKYLLYGAIPAVAATQGFLSITYALVPSELLSSWLLVPMLVVSTATILFFGRKPAYLKPFIVGIYLVLITAVFIASFIPSNYSTALAFTGQGGGLPVSLVVSSREGNENIDGNLFLRTRDFVVLLNPSTGEVKEIPVGLVRQYQYLGAHRW